MAVTTSGRVRDLPKRVFAIVFPQFPTTFQKQALPSRWCSSSKGLAKLILDRPEGLNTRPAWQHRVAQMALLLIDRLVGASILRKFTSRQMVLGGTLRLAAKSPDSGWGNFPGLPKIPQDIIADSSGAQHSPLQGDGSEREKRFRIYSVPCQ